MASGKKPDISKFLKVRLTAPDRVRAGDRFDVTLDVTLSDEQRFDGQQLLEVVRASNGDCAFVDIVVSRGYEGACRFLGSFEYGQQAQIFQGNKYVITQGLEAPRQSGVYNVEARVRGGNTEYEQVTWDSGLPFEARKRIDVVK